jgi:5-hydroxyisourate hydrolase
MTLSTHVLDATTGRPAAGIAVQLERRLLEEHLLEGRDGGSGGAWVTAETGETDADGRAWLSSMVSAGLYRLTFGTGDYFAARGVATFYPEVTIAFEVLNDSQGAATGHYHVPLLLSPFAYSTYRGS